MTQYKPVVGISEAVTLLFIFLSTKTFLFYGTSKFETGMNAAWIIPLLQIGIGLCGLWLLLALLKRFPGQDLVQIGEELAGPYINVLFSLYYLSFIILSAAIVLRGSGERVVAGFLTDTPISLVVLSFVIGSLVVAYLGLEAVSRTARFLVGLLVISTAVLYILTIPFWDFGALFPLLGAGPYDIMKGFLTQTGDYAEIFLLGIICPFIPRNGVKAVGILGVLFAGIFMFLIVLISILVFSYPTVSELSLPSFNLARIINISRFGQRMEIVFLPIWVFAHLIYLSISFYIGSAILARTFNLSDYRPLVLSVTVFIVAATFIPQNTVQVAALYDQYLNRFGFPLLIMVLITLHAAALITGKGGSKGEQGN